MRSKSIFIHVDIYFDLQNFGCVFAYFNGRHKNNFPLCFRSAINVDYFSYMQLEILLRQVLGKKYKNPTILPFLLTIGH